MAWTAPNTFVAGAVLTAAQMNAMQANALAGGPIYATEALRDAAITSPFEGQRAYITGSTVAAATTELSRPAPGEPAFFIDGIEKGANSWPPSFACWANVGDTSMTSGRPAIPAMSLTVSSSSAELASGFRTSTSIP